MTDPHVLQVVLRLDPGGTERLVIEIVRRLHQRLPMAVCCLDAPGAWADRVTGLGVPLEVVGRPPGFSPGVARRIAAVARRTGASVLHCHHYSPYVYGRLAAIATPGLRALYTEHGRLSDRPPSTRRRLINHLLMAGARDLYAVSHDLRGHLVREGVPSRMQVIWNGIDPLPAPDAGARAAARAALGGGADDWIVGTVARLDPVKDLTTMVEAAALAAPSTPALRLVVIGDGPQRRALDDAVARLGIADRVRLLGHRDDVRALLPGLDAFGNSSTSEGISLTLLEAMAAELPIVATRVGGTPEVVADGETGCLVPARDAAAFAAALGALAADPPRARTWGRAGRARVLAHFSIDEMVRRYETVYREMASR